MKEKRPAPALRASRQPRSLEEVLGILMKVPPGNFRASGPCPAPTTPSKEKAPSRGRTSNAAKNARDLTSTSE
jgi:hypothetical protein